MISHQSVITSEILKLYTLRTAYTLCISGSVLMNKTSWFHLHLSQLNAGCFLFPRLFCSKGASGRSCPCPTFSPSSTQIMSGGEKMWVKEKKKKTAISGAIWQKNGEHFEDLPGLNLDPYVEEFCHLLSLAGFPMLHFCVCGPQQNYHQWNSYGVIV